MHVEDYRESKFFNFHVFPRNDSRFFLCVTITICESRNFEFSTPREGRSLYVSSSARRSPDVKAIESRNFEVLCLERGFALRFFLRTCESYWESKLWIFILTMILQKSYRESKFWIFTFREERSSHLSFSVHRESKFLNFYSVSPPFFLSATITVAWKSSRVETLNLHASRRIFILRF